MADPSPLLAGRDPADVLSVWGEGSGKGSKAQCRVESAVSFERGRSAIDSVNESPVKGLEGNGHPLESGCPTGKREEVCHGNLDHCLNGSELAGHVDVREAFGQNRAGGGDDERNGDNELLHRGSPKVWPVDPMSERLGQDCPSNKRKVDAWGAFSQ